MHPETLSQFVAGCGPLLFWKRFAADASHPSPLAKPVVRSLFLVFTMEAESQRAGWSTIGGIEGHMPHCTLI